MKVTYVRTPSARVRAVPKMAQTIKGHLNLANFPNLFSSVRESIVEYVVKLRPSYSGFGKSVMNSANGPPSPSPVPNSRAIITWSTEPCVRVSFVRSCWTDVFDEREKGERPDDGTDTTDDILLARSVTCSRPYPIQDV